MKRNKRMQFWGKDKNDDSLVLEVISGLKTATACRADEYHLPDGEYDDGNWQVDDIVDVYDLQEKKRCIIKITDVYKTKFGDIPAKLWQGENCKCADHFRSTYLECWADYGLTNEFQIMATHFTLLEVCGSQPEN